MMQQQSKRFSLLESIINTFVGLLVTLLVSPLIYWICNVKITIGQMTWATLLFTVVSIARNYFIRRIFNNFKK